MARSKKRGRKRRVTDKPRLTDPRQLELTLRSSAFDAPPRRMLENTGRVFSRRAVTHGDRAVERALARRRVKQSLINNPNRRMQAAVLNSVELGKYREIQITCKRREARRAVLHARGRTGANTSRARRIRTAKSDLSCK